MPCPWDKSGLSLVCFHTVQVLEKPATRLGDLLGFSKAGKTVRHYFPDLFGVLWHVPRVNLGVCGMLSAL